ncbi:MAG: hypothetical protein ACYTG6_13500, partial [Planctomycetota bacterium]
KNAGIVGATLEPVGSGLRVFVTARGTGLVDAASPWIVVRSRETDPSGGAVIAEPVPLDLSSLGFGSTAFTLTDAPGVFEVALVSENGVWRDDLAPDNGVRFDASPLGVRFHEELPGPYADAVRRALRAVLGPGGVREDRATWELEVLPAGASPRIPDAWRLVLHPAAADETGVRRAPPGPDLSRADPLVRDLGTAGVDLVYGENVADAWPREEWQLWREGRPRWPVVARRGAIVAFLPDPLAGRTAPAHAPLWPFFIANLVSEIRGEAVEGAGGYRVLGVLDPETSRLGTASTAFDPAALTALPPDRAAVLGPLRSYLVAAALACLLFLWGRPLWTRVRTRRSAPRAVPSP